MVDEAKTTGPVNSFTGSFVQVQPDDGSSYNEIYGVGSFGRIPGLDFAFEAAQSGVHTLWLRWTGGDTIGGGDSLYEARTRLPQLKGRRGGFIRCPPGESKTTHAGELPCEYVQCCSPVPATIATVAPPSAAGSAFL